MYSRNRVMSAEQRYAENLPPVYGGSRFYRSTAAVPRDPRPERDTEIAATPAAGIPVEYTVRPGGIPDTPPAEEPFMSDAEDTVPVICADGCTPDEHKAAPRHGVKPAREGGLASLLSGDSEEILLIVLILLLGGEAERAADVIVILLLLLVVR